MKSLLIFLAIQIMVYVISMSDVVTISIMVLGSAVTLFAGAFFYALIKDKRHKSKSIKAVFEGQ
jgi:hypothetical protein